MGPPPQGKKPKNEQADGSKYREIPRVNHSSQSEKKSDEETTFPVFGPEFFLFQPNIFQRTFFF